MSEFVLTCCLIVFFIVVADELKFIFNKDKLK